MCCVLMSGNAWETDVSVDSGDPLFDGGGHRAVGRWACASALCGSSQGSLRQRQ